MSDFHTQVLTIEGMRDSDSVHGVSHALGLIPGVRLESVETGRARVLAEPGLEPSIRQALEHAGFALADAHVEG